MWLLCEVEVEAGVETCEPSRLFKFDPPVDNLTLDPPPIDSLDTAPLVRDEAFGLFIVILD